MKKAPHAGLARRHRPQSFDDVVGQETVSTTLKNALEGGGVGQAYLFFGPRGVGKTTTARILAKALNCHKGAGPQPCGECSSCAEIAAGNSIDVLELDAASHTQVDKIREAIIETVSLAPSRDRRKVFIVDEVHMLSTSSFNALLKTLEEPPAHAVFVLATTELAKLPATIVSRCQRFRFRPLTREVLADYLAKIAKAEHLKAEPRALEALARAAGGSARDAISLLEQAASYGEGAVAADTVAELMGALPEDLLRDILSALLSRDPKALAAGLDQVAAEGYDASQLLRDLRGRLEELYLNRLGVREGLEGEWAALAGGRSPESFSFLIRRVNGTLEEMRTSDAPQLSFELGLYGMLEAAHDLGDWVSRLEALEKRLGSVGGVEVPAAAPPRSAPPAGEPPRPLPSLPERPAGLAPAENVWPAVLRRLAEEKPSVAACLQRSRLVPSESGEWRVLFRQGFSLERAKTSREAIEAAVVAVSGRAVRLALELDAKAPAKAAARPAGPGDEGWVDASASADPSEDPAVKKVLGVLGGRVRQVKKQP